MILSIQVITPEPIILPEDINDDTLRYLSNDSFAMWCLHQNIKVDGRQLEFEKHKYLLPLYMDNSREIVLVKAAQLGATVYQLLRILWFLQNNQGTKAGLYLPNKELADNISKDRLAPMIESCPSLLSMTQPDDKLGLRKIGTSSFYTMYLEGKSSKDSVPLDYLSFDEVRLSAQQSVDQAQERISASEYKYKVFMSTCGLPNDSIHKRFLRGKQYVWMAKCGCPDGCDLARTFPNCVIDDPKRGLYLRCPKCRYTIKDNQNGRYVPMNPGADYNSYHVSQLNSKFISLKEIWDFYKSTTNIAEFYNAKLGLPWVDEENRGISMDQLRASVDPSLSWGPRKATRCAMGVDQGSGYVMAIIADLDSNNKKRIRHVEIIENNNPRYMVNGEKVSPFIRLRELMREYDVQLCVVDAQPNSNDALSFAQDFRSRVFLAWYQRDAKHVVQWGDKGKRGQEAIRKAGTFLRFKYTVTLARYLSLGAMLGGWADGKYVCPDPNGLVQMCRSEETNQLMPEAVAQRMFDHMCRLVRQFRIVNEETGEGKHEWIYTGGDPHLAHAMNYLNVALERLTRAPTYTFA